MNSISDIYLLILVDSLSFSVAMYSNLAFVTFIFYLYSFFFYSPRWRFLLQTEISGKYNLPLYFCSLSLFFLSLFLPQGSVYCLSLNFGTQDFTDPGLLKILRTLTGLSWFCLHNCVSELSSATIASPSTIALCISMFNCKFFMRP